jgi:hypothetical protein
MADARQHKSEERSQQCMELSSWGQSDTVRCTFRRVCSRKFTRHCPGSGIELLHGAQILLSSMIVPSSRCILNVKKSAGHWRREASVNPESLLLQTQKKRSRGHVLGVYFWSLWRIVAFAAFIQSPPTYSTPPVFPRHPDSDEFSAWFIIVNLSPSDHINCPDQVLL